MYIMETKSTIADLVEKYYFSNGHVAVLDEKKNFIGLFGKNEYQKLISRLLSEEAYENIQIVDVINRKCSVYVKQKDEKIQTEYKYIPIVDENGVFLGFYEKEEAIYNEWEMKFNQVAERHRIYNRLEKKGCLGRTVECPICGEVADTDKAEKKETIDIFGGGSLIRYQCPKCLAIVGPLHMLVLSEEELSEDYKQHYDLYQEGDTTEREKKTFYKLNPEKGKKYLNYGCGGDWSKSIEELRAEGYNLWGYEPYSHQSSKPYIITNKEELRKHKFDGVFSNNLLEHLRNPISDFELMREVLVDGGIMAHATPCYKYSYSYTRFHLIFLEGESYSLLLEKTGFKMKELIKESDSYICSIVEKKQEGN